MEDEGVSGVSCVGDRGEFGLRGIGKGSGWDIAGSLRGSVRAKVLG